MGVVLVPAFTGLGAPWWDANARGAIFGMTRDSGVAEIAHAAFDACALQTARPDRGHARRRAGRLRQGRGTADRRRHVAQAPGSASAWPT